MSNVSQFMRKYRPGKWRLHMNFSVAALLIGSWLCIAIITGIFIFYAGKETALNTGDYISLDVSRTDYTSTPPESITLPPGHMMVSIDLSIENRTDHQFDLAPVLQTYLTDASGAQYRPAPGPGKTPLVAGPLHASEKRRGTLTYHVPQTATGLVLHFDATEPVVTHTTKSLPPAPASN